MKLRDFDELWMGLFTLDGRGGYFAQKDMEGAVRGAVKDAGLTQSWQRKARLAEQTEEDFVRISSYKLRVMLSHLRAMASNGGSSELAHVYTYLQRGAAASASASSASATASASASAFFPNLRSPDITVEYDDDVISVDESYEDRAEVARYFDGHQWAAVRLWSDGNWSPPDKYEAGPQGLAVARWSDEATLEIEVPNSCVGDDGSLMKYKAPSVCAKSILETMEQTQGLRKRPASAKLEAKRLKPASEEP